MSLGRTALRMASVAALAADPVITSLCGSRIYDSRIDELDAQDPVPVIVIYTEDDKGHPWSVNNGGPPFDHACDLLVEISMRVVVPATDSDPVAIGLPETDAEAEATLDLLEALAVNALTVGDTPQSTLIRSHLVRRATELKSIRFASADSGSKLALRMVTLTTHLKIDQPDPRWVPTGPFASLPEPLRIVAASLPATSAAYQTCVALAALLTPPQPELLKGIDTILQVGPLQPGIRPNPDNPNAPPPFAASIDLSCPTSPSAGS